MIDNIFDNKVKDILRNLKMDYKSDSWKRLENKLNNIDQEDAAFDSIIAGKLKKHAVVASGNAYKRFEKSIESPQNNKYIYYIVGIAATLILIFFTVFNIDSGQIDSSNLPVLISNENITDKISKENEVVTDFPKSILSNQNLNNTKESLGVIVDKSITQKVSDIDIENINNEPKMDIVYIEYIENEKVYEINNNFGVRINSSFNLIKDSYLANSSPRSFSLLSSFYNNDLNNSNLNAKISTTPILINNSNLPIINNSLDKNEKEIVIASTEKSKDNIEELESINNQLAGFGDSTPEIGNDPILNNSEIPNGIFVSANISPNLNLIDTPNDLVLNVPGYDQSAIGLSAGLSISLKNGKNELETGLEFNSVKYSPRKTLSKIDESKSYYLDDIKYDIVKLPLNYKYHVVENKDWDVYSVAGFSANITANSDYRFVEQTNIGGIDFKLEKYAIELKNDNNFQQSLYSKKNYKVGVFEGGKINKNIYLALNAGIGIKRKLKKGLSLFFEPQFNYNFNTFGPNNDNINNINIKLGVSKLFTL